MQYPYKSLFLSISISILIVILCVSCSDALSFHVIEGEDSGSESGCHEDDSSSKKGGTLPSFTDEGGKITRERLHEFVRDMDSLLYGKYATDHIPGKSTIAFLVAQLTVRGYHTVHGFDRVAREMAVAQLERILKGKEGGGWRG